MAPEVLVGLAVPEGKADVEAKAVAVDAAVEAAASKHSIRQTPDAPALGWGRLLFSVLVGLGGLPEPVVNSLPLGLVRRVLDVDDGGFAGIQSMEGSI